MGATLANGGVNPVTGEQAIETRYCKRVLAVLATAGLYERSGEWLYDVGLPGKSGVAGGIVTVSPGKGGMGTFSPPLDAAGNSVRGNTSPGTSQKHWGSTCLPRLLLSDIAEGRARWRGWLYPGGYARSGSSGVVLIYPARPAATHSAVAGKGSVTAETPVLERRRHCGQRRHRRRHPGSYDLGCRHGAGGLGRREHPQGSALGDRGGRLRDGRRRQQQAVAVTRPIIRMAVGRLGQSGPRVRGDRRENRSRAGSVPAYAARQVGQPSGEG